MTLLIVDDNVESRRLLRKICQSLATSIHEASDGESAIRACDEHHPDCVLMDVRMRPMNGLTATQRIHERWPEVHVVIVTNQDDEETQLAATEAGAHAFFPKDRILDLLLLLSKEFNNSNP